MELLSFHVAQELAAREPLTLVRWGWGNWGIPLFASWALLRLIFGLLFGRVRVVLLGDPVISFLAFPAKLARVPVAIVAHGLDVTYPAPLYQAYLRRCFWNKFDAYLCISRFIRDRLIEGGIPADRCRLIPPGVTETEPVAAPAEGTGHTNLLILGRLVRRKGALWFVEQVFGTLSQQRPDLRLHIVGDGPDRAALQSAVARQGLEERVHMHGQVSDAEKLRLMQSSSLVLMPNQPVDGDPEGFGLVALEAGMHGRYVVGADMEGLRDALPSPEHGLLLPPEEPATWVQAIQTLCADPVALREKGLRAREAVRARFSWSAMGAAYARALDELA